MGLGCTLILLILICLNSCVSTITPPQNPENPCSVYLVKEAKHTGIVLPDFKGDFVEYGYGDWDWYALIHNRWYHVFDTVLWPTQGTLSKRSIPRNSLEREGIKGRLQVLEVNQELARLLLETLERLFTRSLSTRIHNPRYGMDFVKHDTGFWFSYNCHDAVADWMEQLGCEVSWVPIRWGIELEED